MTLRAVAGDLDAVGRVSLYRGPLLLAFDQADNAFDDAAIPTVDVQALSAVVASDSAKNNGIGRPWLSLDLSVKSEPNAKKLTLRDYASAGAGGTRYRSWLPAQNQAPPAPVAWLPADQGAGARGSDDRPLAATRDGRAGRAEASPRDRANPQCAEPLVTYGEAIGEQMVVPAETVAALQPGVTYYWKLIASGPHGETESAVALQKFSDRSAVAAGFRWGAGAVRRAGRRCDDRSALAGSVDPTYGRLAEAHTAGKRPRVPTIGRLVRSRSTAARALLRYRIARFPTEDYTLAVRVRIDESAFMVPRRPCAASCQRLVRLGRRPAAAVPGEGQAICPNRVGQRRWLDPGGNRRAQSLAPPGRGQKRVAVAAVHRWNAAGRNAGTRGAGHLGDRHRVGRQSAPHGRRVLAGALRRVSLLRPSP